jgi:hypothetical protein
MLPVMVLAATEDTKSSSAANCAEVRVSARDAFRRMARWRTRARSRGRIPSLQGGWTTLRLLAAVGFNWNAGSNFIGILSWLRGCDSTILSLVLVERGQAGRVVPLGRRVVWNVRRAANNGVPPAQGYVAGLTMQRVGAPTWRCRPSTGCRTARAREYRLHRSRSKRRARLGYPARCARRNTSSCGHRRGPDTG